MGNTHRKALKSALAWYVDHGVDDVLGEETVDRTAHIAVASVAPVQSQPRSSAITPAVAAPAFLGKSDARIEAVKLAKAASTLEELRDAIAAFEGLTLKKTATSLVFCDGNVDAPIMLIGDAPGADEDRQGKPFAGANGQLLDRILKCIDLERGQDDPAKAVYISNILNWRPPGNRTPSPAEIDVSLPFIEKHIMLAKPKLLILCGGVPAKALLGKGESISRLRKIWHEYKPQTAELNYNGDSIPAIATYHPSYLLRTPAQKKAVWADMLSLQQKHKDLDLI